MLLLLWFAVTATGAYFECYSQMWLLLVFMLIIMIIFYFFARLPRLPVLPLLTVTATGLRACAQHTYDRPHLHAPQTLHTRTHACKHTNMQRYEHITNSVLVCTDINTKYVHTHTYVHTYMWTCEWILRLWSTGCDSTRLMLLWC